MRVINYLVNRTTARSIEVDTRISSWWGRRPAKGCAKDEREMGGKSVYYGSLHYIPCSYLWSSIVLSLPHYPFVTGEMNDAGNSIELLNPSAGKAKHKNLLIDICRLKSWQDEGYACMSMLKPMRLKIIFG